MWARGLGLFIGAASVVAQPGTMQYGDEANFIPRSQPYPSYYSTPPRNYNLKWGKLTGRLYGSVQTEFNDNINLSQENPESDLSFAPLIGVGFMWPLSEKNLLEFDVGIGYRAFVQHPELNTINISPDSRLTYQMRILKAQITVHDQFSVQVDPLSRPELSGDGRVFNYRRFNNNAGMTVGWEAIRDLTLVAGYSYAIDRSLNEDFTELDRDDHLAFLGARRPIGSRVTVGLGTSYGITEYLRRVQNDGRTWSVGPQVQVRLSEFLTGEAGLSYTRAQYERTGTIADTAEFQGVTYYAGMRHRLNSRTTHSVRVSDNINPGYGSNFTDIFGVQYGFSVKILAPMTLNGTFVFEKISSSANFAEDSQRYLCYLGTGLRLSSRWDLGVGYSLGIKDSEFPGRDYTQNRVTLALTRHF